MGRYCLPQACDASLLQMVLNLPSGKSSVKPVYPQASAWRGYIYKSKKHRKLFTLREDKTTAVSIKLVPVNLAAQLKQTYSPAQIGCWQLNCIEYRFSEATEVGSRPCSENSDPKSCFFIEIPNQGLYYLPWTGHSFSKSRALEPFPPMCPRAVLLYEGCELILCICYIFAA